MRKAYTVEPDELYCTPPGAPLMVFERVEDAEEYADMVPMSVVIREVLFIEDNRLAKEAREYINAAAND